MPLLSLNLLGGFQVNLSGTLHHGGDIHQLHFPTDKIRALFAYLALEADRPHRRETLATLFWGDWPGNAALRNLRQSLHRLRAVLDQAAPGISRQILSITRQDVTLHSAALQIDVAHLRAGIAAVAHHTHASLDQCPLCLDQLAGAVVHYKGELLAGLGIEDAPEFESWLTIQRESLAQMTVQALSDLADAHAARGEMDPSYACARRQLAIEPWRESAHRQAMRAFAAAGRRSEALNQYKLCCTILAEELGVEPEAETTALYLSIRDALLAPARVRPHTNLPLPLTSFVGRRAELDRIRVLLAKSRLLTLVGPGGSGKTRLALEIGQQMADAYSDGVYWAELAEVTNAQWVPHAVAAALQIPEVPGQPLMTTLTDALRHRHLLLILDNCEHLLDACARFVQSLLMSAPRLQVLATSREGLSIPGEQIAPVPTLPVPDPQDVADLDALLACESVYLLVARAMTHRPDFVLSAENAAHVVEICRRLDGIPLALELAAARMRSLSVGQIAPLLGRRFDLLIGGSRTALPRQQTLRALFDWSYELLTGPERILFRRLGIFKGGWSLAAAEEICADPPPLLETDALAAIGGEPVVHLLGRLVEKSLVQTRNDNDELRYQMLDTIHAYAGEHLTASGEVSLLQERHAHFYAEMAVAAHAIMFTEHEIKNLALLQRDHENLRRSLAWAFDPPSTAQSDRTLVGIRLAAALGYFWDVYGHFTDAERWLRRAWDLADSSMPSLVLADLSSGLGTLAWMHSHYREAQSRHERALTSYRHAGNWRGICLSLHHLAVVSTYLGDWQQALDLFRQSIRAADAGDQREILGLAWVGLGVCYQDLDLYDEALLPLERGVAMLRDFKLARALGYASTSLCDIYLRFNRLEDVMHAVQQIETSAQLTQDRILQVAAYTYWAQLLRRQKRWDDAQTAWGKALLLLQEIGVNTHLVVTLEEFAFFLSEREDVAAALLLLSACEAHRLSYNIRRPPSLQAETDHLLTRSLHLLSPSALTAIRNQGEGMVLEQALAYALDRVHSSLTETVTEMGNE